MAPALSLAPTARKVHVVGFWRRLAATCVDALVLLSVFGLLTTLTAFVLRQPLPELGQIGPDYLIDRVLNGGGGTQAGLLFFVTLTFLYFFLFTALRGQTFGGHLLHVRTIDAFGQQPSFARAALRTAAFGPSLLFLGLGLFWIGFDRQKRGLPDWIADTYVVHT